MPDERHQHDGALDGARQRVVRVRGVGPLSNDRGGCLTLNRQGQCRRPPTGGRTRGAMKQSDHLGVATVNRHEERGAALRVAGLEVGPGSQKELCDARPALSRRKMQRRLLCQIL